MSGFAFTEMNLNSTLTTAEAIERLEFINGTKFSEQQLSILNSNGGIKIVACAGSGKTFSLVNLVAKRIMTGEIENASKLLMTTYSKAGALNMTQKINELLFKAGYKNISVEVRTLHSLYYSILKHFQILQTVISDGQRLNYIRQAVRNCKVSLEEEDITSLNGLFSYQVNNMLSNQGIYNSYVFDLDISLKEYGDLLQEFARLKNEDGCMDFDDLQLTVYYYLCKTKNEVMLQYLHDMYDYVYVDEFQDTSAIQYNILQSMIQNSEGVTFIGDDDQCLVSGTKVLTAYGNWLNIEDIKLGDELLCASGDGDTSPYRVDNIRVSSYDGIIYRIKTKSGNVLKMTNSHVIFARDILDNTDDDSLHGISYNLFASKDINRNTSIYYKLSTLESTNKSGSCLETDLSNDNLYLNFLEKTKVLTGIYGTTVSTQCTAMLLKNTKFRYRLASELVEGMTVCVYKDKKLIEDEIISISKKSYKGKVYDLNIPELRNFIANGVVVHNCIYGWRGAKADLLLNVGADYHVNTLNLDTNYRCYNTILQYAKSGVERINRRELKDMKSCHDGGKVEFVYADSKDLYAMSTMVADKIESMIKVDNIKADDICVLVRYNAHAHVLNSLLMLKDIYCNFGDDMKLSYQTIYKDVINLMELCGDISTGSYDRGACSAVVWKMIKFMGTRNSALLSEFMQNTGCNFTDSISWVLANVYDIGQYYGTAQVNAQIKARMNASFKKLGIESVKCLKDLYSILTSQNMTDRLEGLLWMYKEGMAFMTKKMNKIRNFDCYYKFFSTLLHDEGFESFKAILTKIKLYEEASSVMTNNTVKLTTIHGSKGLEWKNVIVLAYDNISFPDVDYIVSKKDISSVDMQSYLDGERRLAYVAMTRAIEHLYIVTDNENMSLFGIEALGAMYNGSILDFAEYVKSNNYKVPPELYVKKGYRTFKTVNNTSDSKDVSEELIKNVEKYNIENNTKSIIENT